ncbi:hypothetical protein [Spelaeicoccus albus]|uniref:Uncharacterized protein n=1 Tax=Spelaeicoccus albus TaxID=1280376 RepID=A0A7Z0D5M9_9MICO|nr:hypothetical protein [Spelaeicoccus albus]NYI69340.1 hypothetical protein [Spelaeicoccus albus]
MSVVSRQLGHAGFLAADSSDSSDGWLGLIVIVVLAAIIAGIVALIVHLVNKHRANSRRFKIPDAVVNAARQSQRDALRQRLSTNTLNVAAELESCKTDDIDAETARTITHGLDAYSLASGIVDEDSPRTVDMAGALVLTRIAEQDLEIVRSGRKRTASAILCAVNPLHGDATHDAVLEGSSGHSQHLRACRTCARALDAGRTPDWLYDANAPYVEGGTVWARTLFGSAGVDLVAAVTRAEGSGE